VYEKVPEERIAEITDVSGSDPGGMDL